MRIASDLGYANASGGYPNSLPDSKLHAWQSEIINSVKNMPEGSAKAAAESALKAGRVEGWIINGRNRLEADNVKEWSSLCRSKAGATYRQIKEALGALGSDRLMEYASYRVMSDGAFVHKGLESASAVYYFRSHDIADDEMPYAILWKLFSV